MKFTVEARSSEAVAPLALEFFDSNSLGILRDKKAKEGGGSKIKEIPGYANAAIYFEQGYADEDSLYEAMEAWGDWMHIWISVSNSPNYRRAISTSRCSYRL